MNLSPNDINPQHKEVTILTPITETKPPKEYKETAKFNLFVKYYTDKTEKQTFGNGTQSVIKAYLLDPVKQYGVARVIAHENITKLNFLARDYMESRGMTFDKFMDIGISKMVKSDNPHWYRIIGEMAEYIKEKQTPQEIKNQQINVYNLASPEVEDFNKKFQKFLESQ